jgi:hypothetical protein
MTPHGITGLERVKHVHVLEFSLTSAAIQIRIPMGSVKRGR